MPVVDGFELIEHVRKSSARVPIVVISGSHSGKGERRSLQLGANIFVPKPIDAETLVGELNRLLE
jgi:CheY-like chemotaxis protein